MELDSVGDPGFWLLERVIDPCPELLAEGEIADDEPMAESLAIDYLIALREQGYDMPWAYYDEPTDPDWIEECKEGIRREFVAFLRQWRENVRKELGR